MTLTLKDRARGIWRVARGQYRSEMVSEFDRWQGQVSALLLDHGIFRLFWSNEGKIAQGVYRANHPTAARLVRWKARGIKQVISLRGGRLPANQFEAETCAALGLRFSTIGLFARRAPQRQALLRLIKAFDAAERPLMIHCKSGADRTGLAAAIWALHIEGKSVAQARWGFSLRHLHFRWTQTGVLDRVLDAYEARLKTQGPIPFKDWVATEYDPETI